MALSVSEARALDQAGADALRDGNAALARRSFERVVAEGKADGSTFLGLAYACTSLGDHAGAQAATDAALRLEARNVRALLHKADYLHASGNARSAVSFYQAVLKCAPPAAQLSGDMVRQVARAQEMCERHAQEFETYLRGQLASHGAGSARFAQSLDLLTGRKQVYFQEPRLYYFPELPQIQFHERGESAWMDRLEAATDAIREELLAVMREQDAFQPYVQASDARATLNQGGMMNNPDWSAFYLLRDGKPVADHAARCPRTLDALREAPLTSTPSVLFSLLRPGARIPAHTGQTNTRLICHLPLIVPPACAFRVGNDTREWQVGKAWLFDDTIEHEAWNDSSETRVVLLFEVWRPELSETERSMVSAMFDAVEQHRGGTREPL